MRAPSLASASSFRCKRLTTFAVFPFLTVALSGCSLLLANRLRRQAQPAVNPNGPLVIIGSMENEICDIEKAIERPSVTTLGHYRFTKGSIEGVPVVAVLSTGSFANTAAATALAIQRYRPSSVALIGTAGAHVADLRVGDIIIGKKMINLNAYLSPEKAEGEGIDVLSWTHADAGNLEVDGFCPHYVFYGDCAMRALARQIPYRHGRVIEGTICSSEGWNREADYLNHLHRRYGTDCECMEGTAVSTVCEQFDVPMLEIRIISNNHLAASGFDAKTEHHIQEFALDFIKKLAQEKR